MAFMRITLLQPRPGSELELEGLLEELDTSLAGANGMLLSFVLSQPPTYAVQSAPRVGRVSLWQSKDEANHEAASDHILALRSRIRFHTLATEESLMEVTSGFLPEGFVALASGAKQPAHFTERVQQKTLPGQPIA